MIRVILCYLLLYWSAGAGLLLCDDSNYKVYIPSGLSIILYFRDITKKVNIFSIISTLYGYVTCFIMLILWKFQLCSMQTIQGLGAFLFKLFLLFSVFIIIDAIKYERKQKRKQKFKYWKE